MGVLKKTRGWLPSRINKKVRHIEPGKVKSCVFALNLAYNGPKRVKIDEMGLKKSIFGPKIPVFCGFFLGGRILGYPHPCFMVEIILQILGVPSIPPFTKKI